MFEEPPPGTRSHAKSASRDLYIVGDGRFDPGDTIKYQVVISASGMDATNVNFSDTLDANTTFVAGPPPPSPTPGNDTHQTIGNVRLLLPAPPAGIQSHDLHPNSRRPPT